MGDVWEEGYALKELNKRSAELLERKVNNTNTTSFPVIVCLINGVLF